MMSVLDFRRCFWSLKPRGPGFLRCSSASLKRAWIRHTKAHRDGVRRSRTASSPPAAAPERQKQKIKPMKCLKHSKTLMHKLVLCPEALSPHPIYLIFAKIHVVRNSSQLSWTTGMTLWISPEIYSDQVKWRNCASFRQKKFFLENL